MSFEGVADQGFFGYLCSLPDKPETTIRVFDRGDFYSVHNEDAAFAAKELFRTTTVIKLLGTKKNTPSVALNKQNFEKFVRDLLLVRQYRVELYRCKGSKTSTWELVGKASPGNLQQFEEILFGNNEMSATAVVLCVKLATDSTGQKVVGAAFADASMRKFGACEFVDNDQFSNLEALLMQIGPKECLVSNQDLLADGGRLKQVLERSTILVTERKKADFNPKDIHQDLNRLLKKSQGSSAAPAELDMSHAMASLSAIIKYLELLSDESSFGQFALTPFDLSQYMRLDSAAVKALNLLPAVSDGGNKNMCLSGLLNQCRTAQGQRLLSQWVTQPLMDLRKIEERLDIVEVFFNNADLRYIVQDEHLKRIPDLSRLSKKFQRKKANLQDCVRVYQALRRLPGLVTSLSKYDGDHSLMIEDVFIKGIQDAVNDFAKFLELVETTIDLDEVENNEYRIKAEFDEGLEECKASMDEVLEKLPQTLNKAASDLCLDAGKTIKLESNSQHGYYFRVTLKEEKVLRNNNKFRTIETRKDGVRFTNNSLQNLSDEYHTLKATYNEVQSQLAQEVIKIATGYTEPMQSLSDVIASLDALVSFATVASQAPIPYVRPKLHAKGEGNICLKASRHPCLEMQDDVAFIPNDVNLIRGDQEFLIITGPNMGGKSTYIRQVGVITLMAQIGCFVPCESAEVTILDSILARVGAGDSQLKGVSTFMSEMLETASILRSASRDSLIIIDELGRGTSTYDGFGLAWAISEHIAKEMHSFCLFATHFHELTSLVDEIPSVANFHVTALTSDGHLTLLYRVKPGVCDQSFGIHVAKIAQFPERVIQFAKEKARELEDDAGYLQDDTNKSMYSEASSDVSSAKKRRQEKKEGEEIIKELMKKVDKLSSANLSDEEFMSELKSIREEAISGDNDYIKELIGR